MKQLNIKLEQNIFMPNKYGNDYQEFDKDTTDALDKMQVGDSFIVKTYGDVEKVRRFCRHKLKKEIQARKHYTGKTKNDGFIFRVWCTKIISNQQHAEMLNSIQEKYESKKLLKNGMLPKSKTEALNVSTINHNDYRAKIDNAVLSIAECREENRMLVDDVEEIKRILAEELGHKKGWNFVSTGENDD